MAKFGSFKFGETTFVAPTIPPGGSGGAGGSISYERVGWLFQDLVTGENYSLPINPSDCDIPSVQKRVTNQATTAGVQVVFTGRREMPIMNFGGTILQEEHFRALESWAKSKRQIKITDDLMREYWVYLMAFEPTRQRNTPYPWRMDYTARAVILDWGIT